MGFFQSRSSFRGLYSFIPAWRRVQAEEPEPVRQPYVCQFDARADASARRACDPCRNWYYPLYMNAIWTKWK